MIHFLFYICLIFGSGPSNETSINNRNITEFFPGTKGNLTKITWAHAVNNQDLLRNALNSTIMMLEADIVLGQLDNDESSQSIPIMAHPPANSSDLSLQDFLLKIQEFNTNSNNTAKKGVKLDFKSIEVFENSIKLIKELYPKMDHPVWLNADILPGPLNATDIPVDPARFLQAAQEFDNTTLSLGWTTRYGNEITNASYTKEQISEMLEAIRQNQVNHSITFPVRAGIACQSNIGLKGLIDNVTDSTLTLWASKGDQVDVESLRKLIASVGIGRVFVDLPDELKNKLRLYELSGSNNVKPLAVLSLVAIALKSLFI